MLRDNGAWCRLEAEGAFAVHVGWDQYLCIGSIRPRDAALARTRSPGLFPERLDASPYDFAPDDPLHVQCPADADFRARLRRTASAHRATFLEETYATSASRWRRLTRDDTEVVRSRPAPRAQLAVWTDLLTDVDVPHEPFEAVVPVSDAHEDTERYPFADHVDICDRAAVSTGTPSPGRWASARFPVLASRMNRPATPSRSATPSP
ncbi:hypothetical protein [Streptomyces ziwulingensis]|uniref:Uncharacterized protein n=1 Tax=Streptomyces ziwulingensis TaxID=1045501 RepID=A0ABP9C118_9ACTN